MKHITYDEFDIIMKESQEASEYSDFYFDQLINRPVAHILYGPPAYGPGAAQPSQRLVGARERVLQNKTRRKKYKAYYFDDAGDLLYSRDYGTNGLDNTLLHFWIGNTNFAKYYLKDTNEFYSDIIFSTMFRGIEPVRFAFVRSTRVYVEYYENVDNLDSSTRRICQWYDYYPHRLFSETGTPILKDVLYGSPNSPVSFGTEAIEKKDSFILPYYNP